MKGDGIGPEVVDSMLRVFEESNLQSEIILCEGGSEQWVKNGKKDKSYIPDSTMTIFEESDACFKGPTTTISEPNTPRSVAVTLRQKFELYSNIRPIKTFDRLSPNKKLDCVCFREATEGLYIGEEERVSDDEFTAIRRITRHGCNRFINSAMKWANDNNLKKMVAITKRNILKKTDGLFWEEAENAVKGTDVKLSEMYIDNMAMQLVVNPEQFNNSVLISTNLFMDIISELAAGLVGSIGLIYSANIGDKFAMFEAAHGSSPRDAGQNKMNPTAAILSGAWMAEYLGEKEIRDAIFDATYQVINEGKTITGDIGGNASTTQMTDAIIAITKANLRK